MGGLLARSGIILVGVLGKYLDKVENIPKEWNYEEKLGKLRIY